MVRTANSSSPAADAPVARARRSPQISKRKLTLAEAADQWERARRELDRNKPLLEEAAAVLLEHFEKTGRSTYKDRIVLTRGSRLVLDQTKIREYLGAKLADFQKRVTTRSLSLLK